MKAASQDPDDDVLNQNRNTNLNLNQNLTTTGLSATPPSQKTNHQSTTSQSQDPERSITQRTRGATLRLSATYRQLTRHQILSELRSTTVNSTVSFSMAESPLWREVEVIAKIIAVQGDSRLLISDGTVFKLPFEEDTRVLTRISIITSSILSVPISISNSEPNPLDSTIFVDGGAQPNPGAGASALLLKTSDAPSTTISASKFLPFATNNMCEAIALLAGLKLAKRRIEAKQDSKINIVTDSQLMYKGVLGTARITCNTIDYIVAECQKVFLSIAGNIVLCHMLREWNNPADSICDLTIKTALGTGEQQNQDLFIQPTVFPPLPKVVTPKTPGTTIHLPSQQFAVPKNLQEFAQLRKFKTRISVPTSCKQLWADILTHYLQAFTDAPSEKKEEHAIRVMMLPHLYLPANVSTARIIKHLSTATPFQLSFNLTANDKAKEAHRQDRLQGIQKNHRLSEAVTRFAADRKLRSANRLLTTMTEGTELTFQQKLEGLRKKFLPRNDDLVYTSFPLQTVPPFSSQEVFNALQSANRQAANCIDGISKDLLMAAVDHNREILQLLANLLHWMLSNKLTPSFSNILLCGRAVALPKPSGGIRPITVSSLFVKLLGTLCSKRDNPLPTVFQHALGTKEGHVRILHKVKHQISENSDLEVIRVDVANAFGSMPRNVIASQLLHRDPALQQYFRLCYGSASMVAVYGNSADPVQFIQLGEGVKQGDSTSSLFFCLGLDKALTQLHTALTELRIRASIYAYMDDITIVTHREDTDKVAACLQAALSTVGLDVNQEKSTILSHHPRTTSYFRSVGHEEPFVVLGGNIAMSAQAKASFEQDILSKQLKYFDLLKQADLHPQIEFTLLKICGGPRIRYACQVDEHTHHLTKIFDNKVKHLIELMVDPSGETTLSLHHIHSPDGCGIPNYHLHSKELYEASKQMSLNDSKEVPRLPLLLPSIDTEVARAQIDCQWLLFNNTHVHFTPAEFSSALAIRLGVIPKHLDFFNRKCNCGVIYTEQEQTIEH